MWYSEPSYNPYRQIWTAKGVRALKPFKHFYSWVCYIVKIKEIFHAKVESDSELLVTVFYPLSSFELLDTLHVITCKYQFAPSC
jgi:hypothetical protein